MSNPYQTPPPDPYGGYGGQPQQPYAAPQYPQPQTYPQPYQQQPQQYQQPGYGHPQQQPYAPHPVVQPNTYATASVALGLVGILLSCFAYGFLGLIGLGLGIAGLNRSAETGVGRNASIGAIAVNTLAVLISIAVVVFVETNGK